MSCTQKAGRVGRAARLTAGLAALPGQVSDTSGRLMAQATLVADGLGQATAPAAAGALRLLEPTGPRAGRHRRLAGRLARSALTVGAHLSGLAVVLGQVKLAVKAGQWATGRLGTVAAGWSETGGAGRVTTPGRFLVFKTHQVVPLQRSALTGWLNRRELIGRRPVSRSEGVVFTVKGATWHRGTVTFTVGPRRRTISHLQRLSYPAEHYYFDRPLNNAQAVAVATGRTEAATLPGYVGRVSRTESLCLAWAGVKRSLILTRLHWPNDE